MGHRCLVTVNNIRNPLRVFSRPDEGFTRSTISPLPPKIPAIYPEASMRHYRDFNSRLTPLDLKIFLAAATGVFIGLGFIWLATN